MTVAEAVRTLRAVRTFTDQPLSDETIAAILNAGRRAQSSKNDQAWRFVAIRDRATLQALSQCGQFAGHLAGAALGVALVTPKPTGFDLGQAAAFMQLAAWELGVGSCIASMWEPNRAKAVLGIPEDQQFNIAISFGYPSDPRAAAAPRKGGRRALDEVVRWERW